MERTDDTSVPGVAADLTYTTGALENAGGTSLLTINLGFLLPPAHFVLAC
jgi:hypothetical protein